VNAAQAKAYVEGASDRVQGKVDSVAGAITGDKSQQFTGESRERQIINDKEMIS